MEYLDRTTFPGTAGPWAADQKAGQSGPDAHEQETGLELVATNDIHYTFAEDEKAHDILLCIQTGKKVEDEDSMRYEGGQYYCKSEEEMRALFPMRPRPWRTPIR